MIQKKNQENNASCTQRSKGTHRDAYDRGTNLLNGVAARTVSRLDEGADNASTSIALAFGVNAEWPCASPTIRLLTLAAILLDVDVLLSGGCFSRTSVCVEARWKWMYLASRVCISRDEVLSRGGSTMWIGMNSPSFIAPCNLPCGH